MSLMQVIKLLSGPADDERNLSEREARCADVGDARWRAWANSSWARLLALLEHKPVTLAELLGYCAALSPRCSRLKPPPGSERPVLFACYHGVRSQPNLLPLVALVLQRLGVPVLVHGALDGAGGVAAAYVFRNLGILPCMSLAQAQARLDEHKLAFVPTAVLMPGLAELLSLKGRLGFGGFIQAIARMLVPFEGETLQVVGANAMMDCALLREYLAVSGSRALLFEGVEGEAFADPRRRPRIEHVTADECRVLFDAENVTLKHVCSAAGCDRRAVGGGLDTPRDGRRSAAAAADRQPDRLLSLWLGLYRRHEPGQGDRRCRNQQPGRGLTFPFRVPVALGAVASNLLPARPLRRVE